MYKWQCRKCGEHPSSFVGDKPSSARCKAGGDHIWMGVPAGKSISSDWQCIHCGKHPVGWITSGGESRPSESSKCPSTGYKHVWEHL